MKKIIYVLLLLCCFPSFTDAFDLQNYYNRNKGLSREDFVKSFPYYTYLQSVTFTDFKTLQEHRSFLWKRIGDGDDFLYYLGENFINYYPVQIANLTDTIAIGEAYIAEKKQLKINTATNEIYQIIGYYILGQVAQTLKEEIRKGNFDPETPANSTILKRLEDNRIYVTIERGTLQNIIYNIKQGKWDYVFNRAWLKFREAEQKASKRYDALLGPDFFQTMYPMDPTGAAQPLPKNEIRLKLDAFRQFFPMKGGKDHEVNIFSVQDKTKTPGIGHSVWLRRPRMKATYFAYQNVTVKYRQWASNNRKTVALATTGGFTNIHRKPEGLTVENGQIVNAVLMPDRDGLVIVHKSGGISVINLKRNAIKLSLGGQNVLTIENPLHSLIAYSKLLHWCKEQNATLFQTQLLAYSDQILIDVAKARGQLRERRLLALVRDKKNSALHHVLFDIPEPHNLAIIANDLFELLQSRSKKVEALLNLDVGSYNILNVFDQAGKLLAKPKGPVSIDKATNLIIYTR